MGSGTLPPSLDPAERQAHSEGMVVSEAPAAMTWRWDIQ